MARTITRRMGDSAYGVQANDAVAITPDDEANLPVTSMLYVGQAGDVALSLALMEDEENVVLKNLAVGFHPLAVRRVYATGTTAQHLVAIY